MRYQEELMCKKEPITIKDIKFLDRFERKGKNKYQVKRKEEETIHLT
jgi:hypothetical protein